MKDEAIGRIVSRTSMRTSLIGLWPWFPIRVDRLPPSTVIVSMRSRQRRGPSKTEWAIQDSNL